MFPQLGFMEMIIVMGVAVLLFGKRLPEVGRSLGKGIVEFKKGLSGIEEHFDISGPPATTSAPSSHRAADERPASTGGYSDSAVPKFEPPAAAGPAAVPTMEYPGPSAP